MNTTRDKRIVIILSILIAAFIVAFGVTLNVLCLVPIVALFAVMQVM